MHANLIFFNNLVKKKLKIINTKYKDGCTKDSPSLPFLPHYNVKDKAIK